MSWIDGFGNMPHDNRHTLVTELAESSAGDEVIMSIAGHVSRAMLLRYSQEASASWPNGGPSSSAASRRSRSHTCASSAWFSGN